MQWRFVQSSNMLLLGSLVDRVSILELTVSSRLRVIAIVRPHLPAGAEQYAGALYTLIVGV